MNRSKLIRTSLFMALLFIFRDKYVIDTQAIIKFLNGKKVINDTVDSILKAADEGENIIIIPSVVIFEIGYLHSVKGQVNSPPPGPT